MAPGVTGTQSCSARCSTILGLTLVGFRETEFSGFSNGPATSTIKYAPPGALFVLKTHPPSKLQYVGFKQFHDGLRRQDQCPKGRRGVPTPGVCQPAALCTCERAVVSAVGLISAHAFCPRARRRRRVAPLTHHFPVSSQGLLHLFSVVLGRSRPGACSRGARLHAGGSRRARLRAQVGLAHSPPQYPNSGCVEGRLVGAEA